MISFWFKGSVKGEEKALIKKIALIANSIKNTLFSKQIIFICLKYLSWTLFFSGEFLKKIFRAG